MKETYKTYGEYLERQTADAVGVLRAAGVSASFFRLAVGSLIDRCVRDGMKMPKGFVASGSPREGKGRK